MGEDEPGSFDITKMSIDESPFDDGGETIVERPAPRAREDSTVPTETDPLPPAHGDDFEGKTAVLGRVEPSTRVEIHVPVMPDLAPRPSRPAPVALIVALAALWLLLLACGGLGWLLL